MSAALMGIGGGLSGLASLFSIFSGKTGANQRLRQLSKLYSPGTLGRYRGEYLNQFLGSPIWRQMLGNIYGAGNQFSMQAGQTAAQNPGSGLASVIPALSGALQFNLKNQGLSQAYGNASQEALQTLQGYGSALSGSPLGTTPWQGVNMGLGALDQILLMNALRGPNQHTQNAGQGGSVIGWHPPMNAPWQGQQPQVPWWMRLNP